MKQQYIGRVKLLFRESKLLPTLYVGPDYYAGIGTLLLSLVVSFLTDFFSGWYLGQKYSMAIFYIPLVYQIGVCVVLGHLIFLDPGIIPRATTRYTDMYDKSTQMYRTKGPPATVEVVINSSAVRLKFCDTCGIYRPPRTTHCSTCDVCVERFDHHCPWLGGCVGRRNYSRFYLFLSLLSLCALTSLAYSVAHIVLSAYEIQATMGASSGGEVARTVLANNVSPVIICVIVILFLWFVVGLLVYHTYLVVHDTTTYEHIKGSFEVTGNPFRRSTFLSSFVHTIFLNRIRNSLIDFRTGHCIHTPTDSVELSDDHSTSEPFNASVTEPQVADDVRMDKNLSSGLSDPAISSHSHEGQASDFRRSST